MILLENPLIRLNYSPASDILTVDLPVSYAFYFLEVREALYTLINTVRHYDVKRVLMDSRKRIVQIEEEKYTCLMRDFMRDLQTTRLQKLARLHTGNSTRENIANKIQQEEMAKFTLATFTSKEEALLWLNN